MIRFRVRTVLAVIGLVIAAWALLSVVSITRQVLTWILIALFLAIALNPAVDWFKRHGIKRRGARGRRSPSSSRSAAIAGDRLRSSSRRSSTR